MKINHNMSAVIANGKLKVAENRVSTSVERLSSGLRINRAGDDPAGMAISQKMKAQIRGLSRASDNSADGVSVINTADGALAEVHSILGRMRELAVQGANDSNTETDREAVQTEINSLTEEIDRIAATTQFNGVTLLDGNLDYRGYTDVREVSVITYSDSVPAQDYRIRVLQNATQATATSNLPTTAITSAEEGEIAINGETVKIEAGDSADVVVEKIRSLANRVGISVAADTNAGTMTYTSSEYGSKSKIEISCENAALAATLGFVVSPPGEDTQIALEMGFDNTASYTADGTRVEITDRNGFKIQLDVDSTAPEGPVNLEIMHIGAMTLQIGANENETMDVKIPPITTYALDIEHMNYLSHEGCEKAIASLDGATATISAVRAGLGAYENRLEHTISNLDVTEENMTSAMSRIEDVDMAEEMSEYTAANVIQQAGISVLSQANDVPQMVLQLLN